MKYITLSAILLLALSFTPGCKKSGGPAGTPTNDNTPYTNDTSNLRTSVGTPVGNPVNQSIGAGGGTITSPDGVLQLTIPAGALSAPTMIGIQPVTNQVETGLYYGYSLTPNGQQFQKPVTLQFHYKDADLDSVDPAGLGVAYQDSANAWQAFTDIAVDTVGKTVTTQTPHFTIFTLLPDIRLNPEQVTMKVGKTLNLAEQVHFTANPNSTIPALVRYTSYWDEVQDGPVKSGTVWAVNNVTGGNKTIGTITTGNQNSAVYTAPNNVPSPNTVYATLTHVYGKEKVILRSKIRIVDGPSYHVLCQFNAPGLNESGSFYNWTDAGSFDVTLNGTTGSVFNITNRSATITLDHDDGTCHTTLVDPPVGPINITFDSKSAVTVVSGSVVILFDALDPNYYIRDAVWSTQCPGGQPTQMGGGLGPAWPASLTFPLSTSVQTIVSGQYTITVTPIN